MTSTTVSSNILGVHIHSVTKTELLEFICRSSSNREKVMVSNVNVQGINLAYELAWYRKILNQSHLVFCDGYGAKWAAKILDGVELHRLTPIDWLSDLAQIFAEKGLTIYLLGARPGVAEQAARSLMAVAPGLKIVGCHNGHFNKDDGSLEQEAVLAEISQLHPNLLIVGFGMPLQEKWISDHCTRINADVLLPVGGALDILSGNLIRPPRWMTAHGLEWLGRLIIEPRRLWKRYLIGNPLFVWRVLLQKAGLLRLG